MAWVRALPLDPLVLRNLHAHAVRMRGMLACSPRHARRPANPPPHPCRMAAAARQGHHQKGVCTAETVPDCILHAHQCRHGWPTGAWGRLGQGWDARHPARGRTPVPLARSVCSAHASCCHSARALNGAAHHRPTNPCPRACWETWTATPRPCRCSCPRGRSD